MKDLFKNIVPEERLSENYRIVMNSSLHEAARRMLNEIFNSTKQIDKNFIEQFQTHGFDARVWELYLTATFLSLDFNIIGIHDYPDFEIEKENTKIFVEATISKNSNNKPIEDKLEIIKNTLHDKEKWMNMMNDLAEFSLIRMANSLFSKLNKRYWENEWVKGYPLILAIEPFHHALSLMITDSMLPNYLYGIDQDWYYDDKGELIINTHISEIITHKEKSIPAGFFNLPEASNISAVIFSNSGTTAKFSRMGKLRGYAPDDIVIKRAGVCYSHESNASIPHPFEYTVGENGPDETWEQGISMFHNPQAKYPIDKELFPNIVHGYFDGQFYAYVPEFHPMNSQTFITKFV